MTTVERTPNTLRECLEMTIEHVMQSIFETPFSKPPSIPERTLFLDAMRTHATHTITARDYVATIIFAVGTGFALAGLLYVALFI